MRHVPKLFFVWNFLFFVLLLLTDVFRTPYTHLDSPPPHRREVVLPTDERESSLPNPRVLLTPRPVSTVGPEEVEVGSSPSPVYVRVSRQ